MCEHDLCVNLNYGIYDLWVRGDRQIDRQIDTQTHRHTHQYHDSAWPRGQGAGPRENNYIYTGCLIFNVGKKGDFCNKKILLF